MSGILLSECQARLDNSIDSAADTHCTHGLGLLTLVRQGLHALAKSFVLGPVMALQRAIEQRKGGLMYKEMLAQRWSGR